MNYINLTGKTLVMTTGRVFPSEGCAEVELRYHSPEKNHLFIESFGKIRGLPESEEGVAFIVSEKVKKASGRNDLVYPATNHPLSKIKENVVVVPGFVS